MLFCQNLKQKVKNWQERYSLLKEKLLKFKETGKISEETIKELKTLQKEIEEFEKKEVKERVEKLKEIWEENKKEFKIKRPISIEKVQNLIETQLPLPETPYFLLEKVLNQFLKEFEKKDYSEDDLGIFISGFINKNIDLYLKNQLQKGKKKEEIKEVLIRLDLRKLKKPLDYLGFKNREKCHLVIKGNVGDRLGREMAGGQIEVQGNCGDWVGDRMSGGKIEIQGNCEHGAGLDMSDGTLIIHGEVENFADSAFSLLNKGQIWHKGKKIWPKT